MPKSIDINEHYSKYKDLYHEPITAEIMEGAKPAPGWLILEAVLPSPENLSSINAKSGIILTNSVKTRREPIVFKVLATGTGVNYMVDDLVCVSFRAGDRFGDSMIVLCQQEDITLVWGQGILKDKS
jgi:hypothetical protein